MHASGGALGDILAELDMANPADQEWLLALLAEWEADPSQWTAEDVADIELFWQRYRHQQQGHIAPLEAKWTRQQYPLRQFIEEAWPLIEPSVAFVGGWHIDAICQHIEAVTRREIRHLLINVPFRSSKSRIISVMWCAWAWIEEPWLRFLYTSYASSRAYNDAVDCRNIMRSPWYQQRWGKRVQLDVGTQDTKGHYKTTAGGYRISVPLAGAGTGEGGDFVIADDPHNTDADDSITRADIDADKKAWLGKMSNRYTDPQKTCFVVVGQRIAVDDLSGELIKQGVYEHLDIPMEFSADRQRSKTSLGWHDPRTVDGELMCPERLPAAEVATLKRVMGLRKWQAQANQWPEDRSNQLFPEHLWRYYEQMPLPSWFEVIIFSLDARFKDEGEAGSYVSLQVWGKKGAALYLLDRVHELLGFLGTCQALRAMHEKWPMARQKFVEEKANGAAIIQVMRATIPGILGVNPEGSKYARAEAMTPYHQAGNLYLPATSLAPWVTEFVEGCKTMAPPNDDIDAMSQAVGKLMTLERPSDPHGEREKQLQMWLRKAQQRAAQAAKGRTRSRM